MNSAPFAYHPHFAGRRIYAMVLRHVYLLRGSWPRVLELAYWPTMQMLIWGFITTFFAQHSSWVAQGAGVLIAGVLLWDVLFRGNLGLSISFLEEYWSRNLGHLGVSPLRPYEFIVALLTMSMIRTLIGMVPAALLAIPFYHYNIFGMGPSLIAFFLNLIIFGWAVGLAVCGLLLRYGLGAESLAWGIIFALAPLSGVYYPIEILPVWLQPVAFAMPPAHVFEGMRALMFGQGFNLHHFLWAAGLNLAYMAAGAGIFLYAFKDARKRGALLSTGE